MAKGNNFIKDDYFKIDPEAHLIGDMEPINHFPGVQMWWKAVEGCMRVLIGGIKPSEFEGMDPREKEKQHSPEFLLECLDKYGVDIACLLPEV